MMNKSNKNLLLISGFAITKLLLHFLSCTNYGFHRDEYLYLAEGQHLDWGFMEVPPLTPAIGWLVEMLLFLGVTPFSNPFPSINSSGFYPLIY